MTPPNNEEQPLTPDDRLINAAHQEVVAYKASQTPGVGPAKVDPGPHDAAGSGSTQTRSPQTKQAPRRIAHYQVKRVIASGGMGTVYEAAQEHPRRTVAVKVMKHGITSGRALRRFEYESQVLAGLQHPGIAHVYDAGWHEEDGVRLPYFALEYVAGAKSIVEFAAAKHLSVRQRMALFAGVCEAVHHGHQRGVIHRDIKPGNILVDSDAKVKIIDFGVARSTDADIKVRTFETCYGEMVGTLKYMSPEQCHADPHDLDVRSDIYSLGVVLFELLTGRLPYDLDTTPVVNAPRIICEEPPTKISSIDRSLRGDVETIVGKALEKDREHRYQSALAMADDIQRFLCDEPILARPPSMVYRVRKLIRRRRTPLIAAGLLLLIGVFAVAAQARAWRLQQVHQRLALEVELMEAGASVLAGVPADQIGAVLDAAFTEGGPAERRIDPAYARDLVRTCTRVIELDDTHAEAYALRARAYFQMRNYASADKDARKALELDPNNALALRTHAFFLLNQGHFDQAREAYERAFQTYTTRTDLPRDFHNRARLRRIAGEYEEAVEDHDVAVALAPNRRMVWRGRGVTRYMSGDPKGAIADLETASALARADRKAYEVIRCQLWIWEIRLRRNGAGDRAAAEAALSTAEEAAQHDPRTKDLIAVLRHELPPEDYLRSLDGPEAPSDRAQGAYYIGVREILDGREAEALQYFKKAHSDHLHRFDEFDLAAWHVQRLERQE